MVPIRKATLLKKESNQESIKMKTIVSPWLLLNGTLCWRQILRMKGECGWIVWLKSSHNQWRMKTNKVGIHFLSSYSKESMTGSHSVFFSPLFCPASPPSQKNIQNKNRLVKQLKNVQYILPTFSKDVFLLFLTKLLPHNLKLNIHLVMTAVKECTLK